MSQLTDEVKYRELMQDALVQIDRLESDVARLRTQRNGTPSSEVSHALLGQRLCSPLPIFTGCLDPLVLPWLVDHQVKGIAVVPGATWLEMAIAACASVSGDGPVTLENVVFEKLLPMSGDVQRSVQCLLLGSSNHHQRFEIHSARAGSPSAGWLRHAYGEVFRGQPNGQSGAPLSDVQFRLRKTISTDEFYDGLAEFGLQYGSAFRGIAEIRRREGEALGRLQLPKSASEEANYCVHPLLLDSALQVLAAAVPTGSISKEGVMVPIGFDRVCFYQPPGSSCFSHVVVRSLTEQSLQADVRLLDEDGRLLIELTGMRCSTFRLEAKSVHTDDVDAEVSRRDISEITDASSRSLNPALLGQKLRDADAPQRAKLLHLYLRDSAANLLGVPASKLDPDVSLYQWGFDSLMITKLGLQIERDLGWSFNPADLVEDELSLDSLVSYLLKHISEAE